MFLSDSQLFLSFFGGPLILKLTPKTPSPTFFPTKILPKTGIELIVLFIVVAGTKVPLKLIKFFFQYNLPLILK